MTLLITGATGFVMSVMARVWLDAHPQDRAVLLDVAPFDAAAARYFAPVADRLTLLVCDVADPAALGQTLAGHGITAVVHGATVTPISRGSAAEARREPEAERSVEIMSVNLMGTVSSSRLGPPAARDEALRLCQFGSRLPPPRAGHTGRSLCPKTAMWRRNASTGFPNRPPNWWPSATANSSACRPSRCGCPRSTAPWTAPPRAVTSATCRTASPIWRSTGPARSAPTHCDGVGDYLHAEGRGARVSWRCSTRRSCRHAVYNVALGETATIGDMIGWAAEKVPGVRAEVTAPDAGRHPAGLALPRRHVGRLRHQPHYVAETGWRPRPMREAFHAYMDWIMAEESVGTHL